MASNNVGDTYRNWVRLVNDRRWTNASQYLSPSLVYNGEHMPSKEYLAHIQQLLSSCPDDKLHLDMLITGETGDRLAARLIHHGTLAKPLLEAAVTGSQIEWPEHVFVWFKNGLITRIQSLTDADAVREGLAQVPRTPDLQSRPHPGAETCNLDTKYRDYIDAINTHTMAERFPTHCHPRLTHNTRELSLDAYWRFIEDSFEEIQGLSFTIAELVADHTTQRVAARLEFTGRPVTEFRGIQPTGQEVRFWEHVFYQYDEGKIAWVWAMLDLEAYRKCLQVEV